MQKYKKKQTPEYSSTQLNMRKRMKNVEQTVRRNVLFKKIKTLLYHITDMTM